MSSRGDYDAVIRRAKELGFRHERTASNHHQFYAPNKKHGIVVSGNDSRDPHAWDNFMSAMRRAGYTEGGGTVLADALREAQNGAETPAPPTRMVPRPTPDEEKSIRTLVLDALKEQGRSVQDLTAIVRARRPGAKEQTVHTALGGLKARGTVENPERGFWRLAGKLDKGVAPPAAPDWAVGRSSAGCVTGGEAPTPDDLVELDVALDEVSALVEKFLGACARVERVVRKHREIASRKAALRKALEGFDDDLKTSQST